MFPHYAASVSVSSAMTRGVYDERLDRSGRQSLGGSRRAYCSPLLDYDDPRSPGSGWMTSAVGGHERTTSGRELSVIRRDRHRHVPDRSSHPHGCRPSPASVRREYWFALSAMSLSRVALSRTTGREVPSRCPCRGASPFLVVPMIRRIRRIQGAESSARSIDY